MQLPHSTLAGVFMVLVSSLSDKSLDWRFVWLHSFTGMVQNILELCWHTIVTFIWKPLWELSSSQMWWITFNFSSYGQRFFCLTCLQLFNCKQTILCCCPICMSMSLCRISAQVTMRMHPFPLPELPAGCGPENNEGRWSVSCLSLEKLFFWDT